MSSSESPQQESVRLTVETSTACEDAFPDFSDPNLFSASSPGMSPDSNSDVHSMDERLLVTSPGASSSVCASASSSASRFLLPLPTPSSNASQTSFALSEVSVGGEDGSMDILSPEILSADISISADGSFVETTSGLAARELKRRYDQYLGVNKDMRSPYAITAIINQHGKQVYRVGLRAQAQAQEPSPTPELEIPLTRPSPPASQAHRKRVSRMSISSVFKHVQPQQQAPPQQQQHRAMEDARAFPPPASSHAGPSTQQPRKLRKPRSIPDLSSATGSYFGDAVNPQSPPPPTGRAHSHSVTGADMPRPSVQMTSVPEAPPPRPVGDAFSNVMGWLGPPASPMTWGGKTPSSHSLLTPSDTPSQSPLEVDYSELEHPFGQNVSFDSPARNSAIFLPSVIREMQSFESAKTARAIRNPVVEGEGETEPETPQQERPDSLDSLVSIKTRAQPESETAESLTLTNGSFLTSETKSEPRAVPSEASCMFTRYPTTVFDVIQNYRGLPMLDALSATSRQPTIKMSLSSLDGAVPRDDPRFVIWGEVGSVNDDASVVDQASVHGSASAQSRPHSHVFAVHSRKRSLKSKSLGPPELLEKSPERNTDGSSSADDGTQRVLMAATIERWIAQLTSQFDYDELLIFFLTYRTYIDALDLCHLLICRFHWALEEPMSAHEVMVKQIVRVRTFVAIRYWLLTFFRVDFLPNRELCLLFASWLNTLWRDPILDKYNDARNIVKKLKKVAKDCREAHSRTTKSTNPPEKKCNKVMQSLDKFLGDLSSGVNFAATLRKVSAAQHEEEDSDVDLDFNPEESSPFSDAAGIQGFASFANQLGPGGDANNPARRVSMSGANAAVTAPANRPTSSASRILLQQPLHLTILQHTRAIRPGAHIPIAGAPSALPAHHSPFQRVVVNTIGRLGRWKRVLSSRAPTTPLSPEDNSAAFDLELNEAGDLFTVRGGVEQYLKMIDPAPVSPVTTDAPNGSGPPKVTVSLNETEDEEAPRPASPEPASSPQDTEPASRTPVASSAQLRPDSPASNGETVSSHSLAKGLVHKTLSRVRSSEPAESIRSGSSGSIRSFETTSYLGNPLPRQQRLFPDVVSIDDLDYLSDSSEGSGPAMPPGLRPGKKLPNRRDFEFVHRSDGSVSSMGIISRASVAMSEQADSARSSYSSPRLGNQVQQWQMNALIQDLSDDDQEDGGAEAALRRLEGQINPQRQRQKAQKVDGWVRAIQERMVVGDFGDDQPRTFSSDEEDGGGERSGSEDDYGSESRPRDSTVVAEETETEDVTISVPRSSTESTERPTNLTIDTNGHGSTEPFTPTPRQTSHPAGAHSVHSTSDAKPKINEAVPEEILLSRLPTQASSKEEPSAKPSPPQRTGHHPTFTLSKTPSAPAHRSFILNFRAELLAKHFAVIDKEIFLGIKFEELVSDEWSTTTEDFNVRDWMQFLRDRRRKAELRGKGKISVLSAARARFNLVANFVISEVALTYPHDRLLVVSKFIRIAWKAYTINNFATLVAIISGLSSEWVRKATKRSWNRIGKWETRVFDDLKAFCTAEDDFRYIRRAIAALVNAKPLTASGQEESATASSTVSEQPASGNKSKSTADAKLEPPTSCVPFIGVYLSQLQRYSRLPDLIDPSAPTEVVETVPETGNFRAPAHPEVFADLRPLPPSMQIEPLINVQKQRQIAGVIKALVAGQHLANKVEVEVDKRLLTRCLKLSALDSDAVQRLLGVYSDY